MELILGVIKGILKLIKGVFELAFTVLLIGAIVFIYSRYIEPKLFTIKNQTLTVQSIQLDAPFKIVQFTDTHLGVNYSLKQLDKVIEAINKQSPDLILFTGDLIDDNKQFEEEEKTIVLLKKLDAPLGKYAVYGNHDHGGNGTKRYKRIMEAAGFKLLVNTSDQIDLANGEKISIIGIDDMLLGNPQFQKAFEAVNKNNYNLFISHAPDVADWVTKYPIDLQISGHSHGGQVRFPIIGAPFTPGYAQKYIKGGYTFEENSRMFLYVSSGLGSSQLPYRFLNIPEIVVYTLKNV